MPHPHRPQAVQQFVGAAGFSPVVGHIRHLHVVPLFARIVGQRTAEPQVLVVRVGGQHQQIRPLTGRLPHLHPGGQRPLPKGLHLAQNRPLGQNKFHPVFRAFQGQVFVQKPVLAAGFPAAVLVNKGPQGGAVEDQVKPREPLAAAHLHRALFGKAALAAHAAVRKPLQGHPRRAAHFKLDLPGLALPPRRRPGRGAQKRRQRCKQQAHAALFHTASPSPSLYYKERCGPAFYCVCLHFRVLFPAAQSKSLGGRPRFSPFGPQPGRAA